MEQLEDIFVAEVALDFAELLVDAYGFRRTELMLLGLSQVWAFQGLFLF
jgi:hypothetical protein